MNIKELYKKHKDMVLYVIFGIATTAVNIIVYWILAHSFSMSTMSSTFIAWIAAVLFAYTTNRKWVFHSEISTSSELIKEIGSFYACRLTTGIIDWGCMFIFVDILCFNDVLVKIFANILVIILNYIASKLIIFKHK